MQILCTCPVIWQYLAFHSWIFGQVFLCCVLQAVHSSTTQTRATSPALTYWTRQVPLLVSLYSSELTVDTPGPLYGYFLSQSKSEPHKKKSQYLVRYIIVYSVVDPQFFFWSGSDFSGCFGSTRIRILFRILHEMCESVSSSRALRSKLALNACNFDEIYKLL
jgi:hypothetical protein